MLLALLCVSSPARSVGFDMTLICACCCTAIVEMVVGILAGCTSTERLDYGLEIEA